VLDARNITFWHPLGEQGNEAIRYASVTGDGGLMVRLIIAMVVGVVLAVGATAITTVVVNGVAKGAPTSGTIYNYGSR
jgi:hypothetical protein